MSGVKLQIAFLPYKASMWDSLESIWMAAEADPDCCTYVVPIPYYQRKEDGSLGTYCYDGDDLPEYVPVTHYEHYNLKERQPDIIYIHNPYDNGNLVTSIDTRYYSAELKKYTNLLVYVPYYCTSGGMSEGRSLCRAYLHADYIIIQAERYRKFFDPIIPPEKLLPLGSPKFDKVIRMCKNPPEPPEVWIKKMTGKKVYFFNTSIQGMLADTRRFLFKMEYVFRCFHGREDACLLWRPHPLLETTFDNAREEYKPFYNMLKRYFIQNIDGIFDDSPDIENTIALCDAYIGDSSTSITALFGIAGKPLFILNNYINTLPEEDDWRGEIIRDFFVDGQDEWVITQGNKLYHSFDKNYHYNFYCDLSEYSSGYYYLRVIEIEGLIYICPQNAQDILIIENHKVVKKIALERCIEQLGAFSNAWRTGQYLFLIPNRYPAIVRYDIENDCVDYIRGHNEIFVKNVKGIRKVGGSCLWKNYLFLASPVDNAVLAIETASMKIQLLTTGAINECGCIGMTPYEDGICLLPYTGTTITCWNPMTGAVKEYTHMPDNFQCKNRPLGFSCKERPFGLAAVYQTRIVIPPMWGTMFVSIDMVTGIIEEWEPPFDVSVEEVNGYFRSGSIGAFLKRTDTLGAGTYRFFNGPGRRIYDVNLITKEFCEIEIMFHIEDLLQQEPGFKAISDWLKYGCEEKALYTLNDFLDGTIIGQSFDKEKQIEAYGEIAENNDGTCGEKIHQFVRTKV